MSSALNRLTCAVILGLLCALASGICIDLGLSGTAWSLGIIAGFSALFCWVEWLDRSKAL